MEFLRNELPEFITIGHVEKVHGVQGGLKVRPLTDYPPRFKELTSLQVERRTGQISEYQIEQVSLQGNSVYLKLQGLDSRDAAESLRGAYLNIPRAEILPLDEGEFYFFEVVGFEVVTNAGRSLGLIEEVLDMPANAVLRVTTQDKEHLIPVIPDVIEQVNRESGRVVVNPIDGLLD